MSAAAAAPRAAAAGAASAASPAQPSPHAAGVPSVLEGPAPLGQARLDKRKQPPLKPAPLLDLNKASRAELKKLPGISDAEVDRIVANRPYRSKTELVTKHVIGEGPYIAVRRQVYAGQEGLPPIKPAAKATKG